MENQLNDTELLDAYNDLSVGQILALARKKAGFTTAQVSAALRIRTIHLEAIEKDDIQSLPGRVYAIGFVRAYAEYLGLDGAKIVHILKNQIVGHQNNQKLNFPVPAQDSKFPPLWTSLTCFAVFIVVISLYYAFIQPSENPKIPNVPEQFLSSLDQDKGDMELEKEKGNQSERVEIDPRTGGQVKIRAIQRAWVSIKEENGEKVLERIMTPDEIFEVPREGIYTLDTGNAAGLEIQVGREVPFILGKRGEIKRDIILEAKSLLSEIATSLPN